MWDPTSPHARNTNCEFARRQAKIVTSNSLTWRTFLGVRGEALTTDVLAVLRRAIFFEFGDMRLLTQETDTALQKNFEQENARVDMAESMWRTLVG